MNSYKTLTRISIIAAGFILACTSTVSALPITVYDRLEGGSGDVDNVLYQSSQTGTSVSASLNTTGGNFAANFTSPTSLSTGGGQASLTAAAAKTTFTELTFQLLNNATFTKLQLNPRADEKGNITFIVDYLQPAGVFNSASFTLKKKGQNFFTILATEGAVMTKVRWNSTVGVSDANQYRVGGAAPATSTVPRVPDGGVTIALLGMALTGMGLLGNRWKKN